MVQTLTRSLMAAQLVRSSRHVWYQRHLQGVGLLLRNDRHLITNGSGAFSDSPIHTVFVSRYSSIARMPFSRPNPLAPRPPKGAMKLTARYVFTHTVPTSRRDDTRSIRRTSSDQTPAASPYGLSFAILTASSSSSKGITDRTGPKISSRAMVIVLVT